MIWQRRPSPALLAKEDLSAGDERLASDNQARPVMLFKAAGEEIIFSLSPRDTLMNLMRIAAANRYESAEWCQLEAQVQTRLNGIGLPAISKLPAVAKRRLQAWRQGHCTLQRGL